MTNEIAIISEEEIKSKIYIVRGVQVMLDRDLAKIYKCKNGTKSINLAVKRNINKFPSDFYFQLNENDFNNLKFQFETSSSNNYGGVRKLPYVFTEQGVAMLATVINTPIADDVSVKIMRAFVLIRHILINNIDYQKEMFVMQNRIINIDNILIKYNNKLNEHDSMFEKLFSEYSSKEYLKSKLIFENEIYDAYSFLLDIFSKVKEEIIIIDNYCDKKVLDLISKIGVKVTVISKNMDSELIDKYQKQYNNLTVKYDNSFHDRFIIIDKKIVYQLGSSLKDLGKKCSYINMVEDEELEELLKYLKVVIDK